MNSCKTLVVVGLGYVGLPLAVTLGKFYQVIGFDINPIRVGQLQHGVDKSGETKKEILANTSVKFTFREADLYGADVFIIAVPTPVNNQNEPDLDSLGSATECVGRIISKGAIVVFESTVYPGVTEKFCGPILESTSGLKSGEDFYLGYSPERINPGDTLHTVDQIVKVVAGQTQFVVECLSEMYGRINGGKIHVAKDIKTAEAAKIIENAQRDINIAFMNEIAQIFDRLDISIYDVLEVAKTKWNFLPFTPGLVGGHCIGVDPYYLAHVAKNTGFNPNVVLSGRKTNDSMAEYVSSRISAQLTKNANVLVLGLTFKEDVTDLRNSKAVEIVKSLESFGHQVSVHDPIADPMEATKLYGIKLVSKLNSKFDCVLGCVTHQQFHNFTFEQQLKLGGLVADIKGIWRDVDLREDLRYWSL